MTVQDLIDELIFICGDKDPKEIEVKKVVQTPESVWGFSEDWEEPRLDRAGGNEYPFVVFFINLIVGSFSIFVKRSVDNSII